VTDPAHPLYGRQFEIVSAARNPDGHVFVRYRDGIVLRLPRAATSLLTLDRDAPAPNSADPPWWSCSLS